MNRYQLQLAARSLTVLGNLRNSEIYRLTCNLLESYYQSVDEFCSAYSAYCKCVLENRVASRLYYEELLYDENIFARYSRHYSFSAMPEEVRNATGFDLVTVKKLASLTAKEILKCAAEVFEKEKEFILSLPQFPSSPSFPLTNAEELYDLYKKDGYGFFARGRAFYIENGKPVCIEKPDRTRLNDLKGYIRQKQAIIANTVSFLKGMECNNILLYGDKGTGKSSTVKAIVNEYAHQGLKIIELKITQISEFLKVCELAGESPFKFIIFLDDLSFSQEDSNFSALKAFIEGGIAGKPDNILIYATSNRRHLVREGLSERMAGDDIHLRDTLETITSLSDRFGLEITFSVPDKDEYLDIVDILAEEYGLELEENDLHMLAERFALKRGGRSPRTARQFLSHQLALMNLEE